MNADERRFRLPAGLSTTSHFVRVSGACHTIAQLHRLLLRGPLEHSCHTFVHIIVPPPLRPVENRPQDAILPYGYAASCSTMRSETLATFTDRATPSNCRSRI